MKRRSIDFSRYMNNLFSVGAETTTGCRLAASALGKRGVSAEDVGREATEDLLMDLSYQACVDRHLQDQVRSSKHSLKT